MKQPFRMLLATDYSSYAKSAEKYAVELAKKGHILGIIHVFNPPLEGALASFEPEDPNAYEMENLQEHYYNLLKESGIKPGSLNCKCIVNDGINISECIVEAAEDFEADFIIMGTHGAGKLNEVLMGSHTWDATRISNIPILAIPDKTGFRMPENIAFITACDEGEIPALQLITVMAKQFESDLTILHFSESSDAINKVEQAFDLKLRSMIHYPGLKIEKIEYVPKIDNLQKYCKKQKIDWIVISPEKLAAWNKVFKPEDGTSHLMDSGTHTPILIVPDYRYLTSKLNPA